MSKIIITALMLLLVQQVGTASPLLSGPVNGGSHGGPFSAPTVDVAAHGYVVEEFFFEGDARAFELANGSHTGDGVWSTKVGSETRPFKSRFLVVRPAKDADFNGSVIVHWQNVTAGYELGSANDAEYLRGYAWVGVSAQKVGVDGFESPAAAGLRQWDAERYGSLQHPGDAWSYDIFTQAAELVGPSRKKSGTDPMGGLNVKRLIAAGASQSAARLRTYINGVHPVTGVFDGFITYIDFGSIIPFAADMTLPERRSRQSTRIRSDLETPVFVVNSETEVLAYLGARQPDSDMYRHWEVAGTSHVSVQRGSALPGLGQANWLSFQPVYVAAVRHMHRWLVDGVAPPRMPLVGIADAVILRDDDGNARGGIRLPGLEVPTASHSGMGERGKGTNRFAFLYGQAKDFDAAALRARYPSAAAFMALWDAALSESVAAGVVLAEDSQALREPVAGWATRLDAD